MNTTTPVNLTGIPETMLWTLHNRAAEAKRPDGLLRDPDCVRIYDSISYDFTRSFGEPDASHPMRSRLFDEVMRPWMAAHPGGTVVELGVGLETQFQRLDDGQVRWLCVDVPEAIAVRERFLPATERCRYVKKSALDLTWSDEVAGARNLFVSAQGLFMYFTEEEVRALVTALAERFADVELMFDTIPPWFSKKTLKGFQKTKHYTVPPMPWGIARSALAPLLRSWSPRVTRVDTQSFGLHPRGLSGLVLRVFGSTPGLCNIPPTIAHVTMRGAASKPV